MYLLYADDSRVTSDPNVKYSVLAGFATFENQTYWIQKAVDDIMLKYKKIAYNTRKRRYSAAHDLPRCTDKRHLCK